MHSVLMWGEAEKNILIKNSKNLSVKTIITKTDMSKIIYLKLQHIIENKMLQSHGKYLLIRSFAWFSNFWYLNFCCLVAQCAVRGHVCVFIQNILFLFVGSTERVIFISYSRRPSFIFFVCLFFPGRHRLPKDLQERKIPIHEYSVGSGVGVVLLLPLN